MKQQITPEIEKTIQNAVRPIIVSVAATSLVAVAGAVISKLLVTNVKKSGLTGEKHLMPTEEKTAISKVETAASETEGSLAKDSLAAQDGSIKAAETEAKAATGEATAAESGATALRTKAGASDIEVKALKIT